MIDLIAELKSFSSAEISSVSMDDSAAEQTAREAYQLYNSALKMIEEGHAEQGYQYCKQAVRIHPDCIEAVLLLGACYFYKGNRLAAMRLFCSIKQPGLQQKAMDYFDHLNEALKLFQIAKQAEEHQRVMSATQRFFTMSSTMVIVFVVTALFIFIGSGRFNVVSPEQETGSMSPRETPVSSMVEEMSYEEAISLIKLYAQEEQYSVLLDLQQILPYHSFSDFERKVLESYFSSARDMYAAQQYAIACNLRTECRWSDLLDTLLPITAHCPSYENMPDVLYFLGLAYEEMGDAERAVECYRQNIDEYTDNRYMQFSQIRLSLLERNMV